MARRTRTLLSTGEVLDPRLLPRLGTRRNYDRRTLGAEVGAVARLLGQPLLPHQQYAADVTHEVDDDDELFYREVNLAWPRRAGKTNLVRSVAAYRCRVLAKRWGPQNVYYTAQSGLAARRKWEHDQVRAIDQSQWGPLGRTKPVVHGRFARVKLDNNDPGIFWANGSIWRPAPPTETAGHGDDADLAIIDEAFAHATDRVEQAYGPAMLTRQSPQLWVMSAAGTERSSYWWPKVEAGRRLDGSTDGPVCYLEHSAGDDEDPLDPETWWRRIPTLGITVTEAALAAELAKAQRGDELDEEEREEGADDVGLERFLRPYLGIWCRKPVTGSRRARMFTGPQLARVAELAAGVDGYVRPEAFGIHVSADRLTAAVGFASQIGDGLVYVGVMDHRPGQGLGWLRDRVAEIRANVPGVAIAVNPRSDAGSFVADLEAGGDVVRTAPAEFAGACGDMFDRVVEGRVCWRQQRALESAVDVLSWRKLAGARAWDGPDEIVPMVAVTLAVHALRASSDAVESMAFVL